MARINYYISIRMSVTCMKKSNKGIEQFFKQMRQLLLMSAFRKMIFLNVIKVVEWSMPSVSSIGILKAIPDKLKYLIRLVMSFFALNLLDKRLPGCCLRISEHELSAAERAIRNGAIIVDLRIAEKYNIEHMGDAINIPAEMMAEAYVDLPKGRELVLYCGTGIKSAKAAKFLRKKGWKVYDIGTRKEWNERSSGYSRH